MTGAIKSLSSFYAGVAMMALEFWFLLSLFNYYHIYYNRYATLEFKSFKVIFVFLLILIINYLSFNYSNQWKVYVGEFDQLPRKKI